MPSIGYSENSAITSNRNECLVNEDNLTSGDITLTFGVDDQVHEFLGTLTANRLITFDTSQAQEGDKFILVFYDAQFNGFTYSVTPIDGGQTQIISEYYAYTFVYTGNKVIHINH